MPSTTTWWRWLSDDANEDLRVKFRRARSLGTHALADECLEIIDDATSDVRWIPGRSGDAEDGHEVANTEFIARSRARADIRLRLIGMWNKRDYGDKKNIEVTGPNGGPIKQITTEMTAKEAADAYREALSSEGEDAS